MKFSYLMTYKLIGDKYLRFDILPHLAITRNAFDKWLVSFGWGFWCVIIEKELDK